MRDGNGFNVIEIKKEKKERRGGRDFRRRVAAGPAYSIYQGSGETIFFWSDGLLTSPPSHAESVQSGLPGISVSHQDL